MLRSWSSLLALSLSLWSLARPELAHAESGRVGLELSGYAGGHTQALSVLLDGGVRVASSLEITAEVPFVAGHSTVFSAFSGNDQGGAFFGNPTLGALYVLESERTTLRVGGRVALPLLDAEGMSLNDGMVAAVAVAMEGTRNPWLWLTDALSLVAPWEIEHTTSGRLLLSHDGALSMVVPLRLRADVDDTIDLTLQARAAVGYAHDVIRPALGVGFAWVPTVSGDTFQSFVEPRVRFLVTEDAHVDLRATINLDGPFGFSFEEDKVWGLHVGAGARF